LIKLSLLKMSPGGGAASLGIVSSQGPLPDLGRAFRAAVHRLPFARTVPTGWNRAGRSCSAFVPGYRPGSTAIFAPEAITGQIRPLNPALAPSKAKSPREKALTRTIVSGMRPAQALGGLAEA
jgi:hypothetical protein